MTVGLAYLCGEYPRATDTFIQREVAGLREAGLHVETISVRRPAAHEQGTEEQDAERRRTHYLLPCPPWRLVGNHLAWFLRHPLRYLRAIRLALTVRSPGVKSLLYQIFYFAEAGVLAAKMRRLGVSHVHNHAPDASGYVAMIAGQMAGITYSLTLHGHGIFSEARRWRLKEKIEGALFVICVSNHGRSQAMLWSDRGHWDKLHVIRCGIETQGIAVRMHARRGRNILFVGRLDHVKGLPILIEAFSFLAPHHPPAHLHIVGDGPARQDVESMVIKSGMDDRVTLYGYQSQTQLQHHLAVADVFAMSSFVEGIPVVLMEAMAHGVPVVAPRITAIPELVNDEVTGLLALPGDSATLQTQIQRLLDDPELRNRLGQAGRELVQQEFSLDVESDRLVTIMRNMMSPRS